MGMPETAGQETRDARRWSRKAVLALPDDGNRYELIDGELVVTPAPRGAHQVMVRELFRLLDGCARAIGGVEVLWSPADISLGEDEILQPDLFVYRTAAGKPLREWHDIEALLLVVEVLSPATARYDRQLKRRRYQRAKVPEYWIVDLDARLIERWRPDDDRPEVLADRITWMLEPGGSPCDINIAELFA